MSTTTNDPATTEQTDRLALYRLCLDAPASIVNGASVLKLSLLVDSVRGTITGQGEITPEELLMKDPEPAPVRLTKISGTMHTFPTGPNEVNVLMSLHGTALVDPSPIEPLTISLPFTATFSTNSEFSGHGGWTVGKQRVEGATIERVKCDS